MFLFFNDTATTEIYTLSLHDALPISRGAADSDVARTEEILDPSVLTIGFARRFAQYKRATLMLTDRERLKRLLLSDRKSTRLNSSHANISYAVFCLKKKKYDPSSPRP